MLTRREEVALKAFRGFAQEFSLERAVVLARRSYPTVNWEDPELAERMADIAVELRDAGQLKG